jgi:hypothetical protein
MAADDGQQRSSNRRVEEASEALREDQERQRLLAAIAELERIREAGREDLAATHRLQAAVDELKRDLEVPEHERPPSWEAKFLSHMDELMRAGQFLRELDHLELPPRSESE